MKQFFKSTSGFRYVGLALILVGLPLLFFDNSSGAEIPLLVGLYILFISKLYREDERAIAIRYSSTYIALILGYGIKLLTTNLYSHQLISYQLTEINHFLILVLGLALIIFYCRVYITIGSSREN
jgi:hypothetical protein